MSRKPRKKDDFLIRYESGIVTQTDDKIHLADGRVFSIDKLMSKYGNRQLWNLSWSTKTPVTNRSRKYTDEERTWISKNRAETVARRYKLSIAQARNLIYTSRAVIEGINNDNID